MPRGNKETTITSLAKFIVERYGITDVDAVATIREMAMRAFTSHNEFLIKELRSSRRIVKQQREELHQYEVYPDFNGQPD